MILTQRQVTLANLIHKPSTWLIPLLIIPLAFYELWEPAIPSLALSYIRIGPWLHDWHYFVWGQLVPFEVNSAICSIFLKIVN